MNHIKAASFTLAIIATFGICCSISVKLSNSPEPGIYCALGIIACYIMSMVFLERN